MKNVVKAVVIGLVVIPMAFLGGCSKRCGDPCGEPCGKLEKIRSEYCGK